MLLKAAQHNNDTPSRQGGVGMGGINMYEVTNPALDNDMFGVGRHWAPPSPASTPSRLLFPQTGSSTVLRPSPGGVTSSLSPFGGGMLNGMDNESPAVDNAVGSIWKQPPGSLKRKNPAAATARRPLLAQMQTPQGQGHNGGKSAGGNSSISLAASSPSPSSSSSPSHLGEDSAEEVMEEEDLEPTPLKKTPRASSSSTSSVSSEHGSGEKKKKDRKAYSTAGRPRVRGEYKCGKCGFMPKKTKHDCVDFKQRLATHSKRGGAAPRTGVECRALIDTGDSFGSPGGGGAGNFRSPYGNDMSPLRNPVFD